MADAWERVEAAMRRVPHAYVVSIAPALPPVLPYRARVEATYLPPGRKRRRTHRYTGEGLTVGEALDALAAALENEP